MTIRRYVLPAGKLIPAFLIVTTYAAAQTNLETLHAFRGAPNDGAKAYGGLAVGPGLVLYGVTPFGGSGPCASPPSVPGCGTMFSLTPPRSAGGSWTEAVLYNFPSPAQPQAGLAVGEDGVLYGTTLLGGSSNFGTVFSLTPPSSPAGEWTETVLYSFSFAGGPYDPSINPSGIAIGKGGVLYGTTLRGGTNDSAGMAFSLAPPSSPGGEWTETVLYNFSFNHLGGGPSGVAIGKDGVLYGTAGGGHFPDGMAFALIPSATPGGEWTERAIHDFGGNGDGVDPFGGVAIGDGGVLYGTTQSGGTFSDGTVFSLTPPAASGDPWTEAVIYSFTGTGGDGYGPTAPVVIGPGGVLYGTTPGGGTGNNGTVFSLTPPASPGSPWTETVLYGFAGGANGGDPVGNLTIGPGVLFGVTYNGGTAASLGTIFLLGP